MSTRLLKDLETRAHEARSDAERLQIRAERAGALARAGCISEARQEISELRGLNKTFQPSLAAWILFAEGLIEHFESLSSAAQDKFNRAYAIGASLGDKRLSSEAAAWIAACEYLRGELPRAALKAIEALDDADEDSHTVQTRAHLVLADCYNGADRLALAKQHYAVARSHAVANGDLSMLSAILYNQAADSLSRLCLDQAVGSPLRDDPRQVALEVESVLNLDTGAGMSPLPLMNATLAAQLAVAQQRWDDGLRLYDDCLEIACAKGQGKWRAKFLADRALCASKLGRIDRANADLAQALDATASCTDDDDLAITFGRISEALRTIGSIAAAEVHEVAARAHRSNYSQEQQQLREALPRSPLEKKNPGDPGFLETQSV